MAEQPKVQRLRLQDDPAQEYFLYVPSRGGQGAPLFVTVHGISRNADVHTSLYAAFAEQYGVVMAGPLFPEERYGDYQLLGWEGKGERADHMFERLVAEVAQATGARADKLYLFGYSGGGQFVHRYTMAYPHRVAGLVVGAAGWYTFPDDSVPFPRGLQPTPSLPDLRWNLGEVVQIPTMVVVGENDTGREASLHKSEDVDQQQGLTRVERGRRWAEAMAQMAERHGVTGNYGFRLVPTAAHSFSDCMQLGGMGPVVFEFLFGQPTGA